jgi:hypothetical protein
MKALEIDLGKFWGYLETILVQTVLRIQIGV